VADVARASASSPGGWRTRRSVRCCLREEIQQEMLDRLNGNMRDRHITNVRAVLGTIDNPKLPKDGLDLVLLVDVYHEFSEPEKMLDRIRDSLKPNGRLYCLSTAEKTQRSHPARTQDDAEAGPG